MNKIEQLLINTIVQGDLAKAKSLMAQGAVIKDINGNSFICAVTSNDMPMVIFLIEKGVQHDTQDNLALMQAVRHGHLDMVQYLVAELNQDVELILDNKNATQEVREWALNYKEKIQLNEQLDNVLVQKTVQDKKIKI